MLRDEEDHILILMNHTPNLLVYPDIKPLKPKRIKRTKGDIYIFLAGWRFIASPLIIISYLVCPCPTSILSLLIDAFVCPPI